MEKRIIKAYKFNELDFTTKTKLVEERIVFEEYKLDDIIKDIIVAKFKEQEYTTIQIFGKTNPLIIEGTFIKGLNEYTITRENDTTKFYSNEFIKDKKYSVSIHNMDNVFVTHYIKVYRETNELYYLIKGVLEEQFYEELKKEDRYYSKEGLPIDISEPLEDADYEYN